MASKWPTHMHPRKVIKLQRQRFPDLKWVHADLRRMPRFKDKSFDIVIEKALKLDLHPNLSFLVFFSPVIFRGAWWMSVPMSWPPCRTCTNWQHAALHVSSRLHLFFVVGVSVACLFLALTALCYPINCKKSSVLQWSRSTVFGWHGYIQYFSAHRTQDNSTQDGWRRQNLLTCFGFEHRALGCHPPVEHQ